MTLMIAHAIALLALYFIIGIAYFTVCRELLGVKVGHGVKYVILWPILFLMDIFAVVIMAGRGK